MSVYAFNVQDKILASLQRLSLESLGIRETRDLQESIAKNIRVLGEDLLVLGVEVNLWENSRRRIDILCIDFDGRPVVVELKRGNTDESDLQALRYASLISTTKMDDLIRARSRYLPGTGDVDAAIAAAYRDVITHCNSDDEPVPITIESLNEKTTKNSRIILLAEDFSAELATTVRWLSENHGVDICLMNFKSYQANGMTLLDIQQIFPVPNTDQYQIRRREEAEHQRAAVSAKDYTRYDFNGKVGLAKNRLVLEVVKWYQVKNPRTIWADIKKVFPDQLQGGSGGVVREIGEAQQRQGTDEVMRYFFDSPLTSDDGTEYVVSRMWGKDNLSGFILVANSLGASISISDQSTT